jgi:hypothetical protein
VETGSGRKELKLLALASTVWNRQLMKMLAPKRRLGKIV